MAKFTCDTASNYEYCITVLQDNTFPYDVQILCFLTTIAKNNKVIYLISMKA